VSDGIRLEPCQTCMAKGWIEDGMGDWLRCWECNPAPIPKESAKIIQFARGAKVKQKPVDDLPPAA
jgi:hypothetical protein